MTARQLIAQANKKYSAEYNIGEITGVSNHISMCLFALESLGAPKERLEDFYNWYVPRLAPRNEKDFEISDSDWTSFLGQHKYNQEYFDFFCHEIKKQGVSETLKKFLPKLFSGVGGAAFHPLIRLSFALELNDEVEIAEALASWGMGHLKLSTLPKSESQKEILDIFNSIEHISEFKTKKFDASAIFNQMELVSKNANFKEVIVSFGLTDESPSTHIKNIWRRRYPQSPH